MSIYGGRRRTKDSAKRQEGSETDEPESGTEGNQINGSVDDDSSHVYSDSGPKELQQCPLGGATLDSLKISPNSFIKIMDKNTLCCPP